jgi:hypothetical protein
MWLHMSCLVATFMQKNVTLVAKWLGNVWLTPFFLFIIIIIFIYFLKYN